MTNTARLSLMMFLEYVTWGSWLPLLALYLGGVLKFTAGEIGCLENHGYSLADAAVRSRAPTLCSATPGDFRWPQPEWSSRADFVGALARSHTRRIFRDAVRYGGSFFKIR